jgi:hypothetical protein
MKSPTIDPHQAPKKTNTFNVFIAVLNCPQTPCSKLWTSTWTSRQRPAPQGLAGCAQKSITAPPLRHPRNPVRLETQICHAALFGPRSLGVVQAADFQRFFALLAATSDALDPDTSGAGLNPWQGVFGFQVDQHQAPTALFHGFKFADLKAKPDRL